MLAPDKTVEVSALIKEGIDAAKAGNRTAAGSALQRAVALDPGNDTAWVWLASVQSDTATAVYCLERAVQANSGNTRAAQTLEKMKARSKQEQGQSTQPTPQPRPAQPAPTQAQLPPQLVASPFPPPTADLAPIEVSDSWRWNTGQSGPLASQGMSGPLTSRPLGPQEVAEPTLEAELSYDELKRRGIVA